jgi:hypothetical protein
MLTYVITSWQEKRNCSLRQKWGSPYICLEVMTWITNFCPQFFFHGPSDIVNSPPSKHSTCSRCSSSMVACVTQFCHMPYCQSKLVLLIGRGGAFCENVRHFDDMLHSFAYSQSVLKSPFSLGAGQKRQRHRFNLRHEPGGLHLPLKSNASKGLRSARSCLHPINIFKITDHH